jgi:addiction module HigA family antidote
MDIQQHKPMHPGTFIRRVYLEPFNVGSNQLARQLKVSPGLVSRLLNEKTDISPLMALKLSKVIGRSPESWLQMQDNYDLWLARLTVDLDDYQALKFGWLDIFISGHFEKLGIAGLFCLGGTHSDEWV